MPAENKINIVNDIKQRIQNSTGFYLTRYTGMSVSQATELRRLFRDSQVSYYVSKNTLTRIAAKDAGFDEKFCELLNGQIAIAYAQADPTAPARVIRNFTKENKDVSLEVVGLVFEGQLFSAEKYKELADLPSKEVLLSKLLSGLAHPMTNLAGTLNGAMCKLAMTLSSLKETKS